MNKNEKGIALAYTVMVMALVFAVCTITITVTLMETSFASTRSVDATSERIGDIFYDCAELIQPSDPSTEFVLKLKAAGFDVSDDMIVTHNKVKLAINLSASDDEYTLIITNVNNEKTCLTVKVHVSNGKKTITQWERN